MGKRKAAAQTQAVDAVAVARAEVVHLRDLERDFAAQRQAKAAELAELVSHGGDQVVDAVKGGDQEAVTRGLGKRVAELRGEIDTLDAASDSTRRRRRQAIPQVREAQALAAERIAEQLEAEAAQHQRDNDRLLAKLEEHAGCRYEPARPAVPGQPPPLTDEQRARGLVPAAGLQIVVVGAPKFQILRNDATVQRHTAAALRRQVTIENGTVEGVGIEAIIDGVLADPMRIGPPIGEVISWAQEVEANERRRRIRREHGGRHAVGHADPGGPIGLRLSWRAGAILPGESRAFALEAEQVEVL
jgi:hypothetical protein